MQNSNGLAVFPPANQWAVSPSLLAAKCPGKDVQGILRGLVAGVARNIEFVLYQSATIGPPPDAFVPKADRLASVPGTHHDLSLLTERLAACHAGSKAERAALSRKNAVARRALALRAGLFAEKPSAVRRKAGWK